VSTPQSIPVLSSKRAREVGLSKTGGCTATRRRSAVCRTSPAFMKRQRSRGIIHSSNMRPTWNQVVSSVALGHISSACMRLPLWSRSSWLR